MKFSTFDGAPAARKAGGALLALLVASAMGLASLQPALADADNHRDEHRDKGAHNEPQHGDRDRHEYVRPRYVPQPVYVAPPVYYPPQQSPGISLFLPLDVHIR